MAYSEVGKEFMRQREQELWMPDERVEPHFRFRETGLRYHLPGVGPGVDLIKRVKKLGRKLEMIRRATGKPMIVTSWYRSPEHPLERDKAKPGAHTYGLAADIACHGDHAYDILHWALQFGIPRIGISQKGHVHSRFLHLDLCTADMGFQSPWIWTY